MTIEGIRENLPETPASNSYLALCECCEKVFVEIRRTPENQYESVFCSKCWQEIEEQEKDQL